VKSIVNDIALIKLDRKVDFDQNIKPIDLPDKNLVLKDGVECTATGWGLTDADSKIYFEFKSLFYLIFN
jgi:hypothetical protein